jgi:hypothetical protein
MPPPSPRPCRAPSGSIDARSIGEKVRWNSRSGSPLAIDFAIRAAARAGATTAIVATPTFNISN